MNFKKLQAMQLELDNSILSAKPQMSAEERFNKTLVALSVEMAEVSNCSEHFKFWKDNKGKVDEKRFYSIPQTVKEGEKVEAKYADLTEKIKGVMTFDQAHKLTLVEECSDCLHFILSLANQIGYEIDDSYQESYEDETLESIYLNLIFQISILQTHKLKFDASDTATMQVIINWYFEYISKLGITTQELEQAYYEKNEENYRRLREGY